MRFAPVFVLAPARSHSSVVATMIGQHPQLFGFPELSLFRGDRVGPMLYDPPGWNGQPAKQRLSGLLRALAEVQEGDQTTDSVTDAYRWLRRRRQWSVANLYDYLLESVAPLVGVEKSPDNSGRAASLTRLATAYPRTRYIHLVRHPLSTVVSMHEAWVEKPYWDVKRELFHQFCLGSWYFHHSRILRFTASVPERSLRVRAEDVVNNPEQELRGICQWLGIDDNPAALDAMSHPERSSFAKLGPQGAMGGNDPKFLRSPALRPAIIPAGLDVPSDWVVDPWTVLAAIELGHRFGYSDCEDSRNL